MFTPESVLQMGKEVLARDGEVLPVAFVNVEEGKPIIIGIAGFSPERADLFTVIGQRLNRDLAPEQIIFMTEVYTKLADLPLEDSYRVRLADDPAAQDALIVISVMRDGPRRTLMQVFEKQTTLEGHSIDFGQLTDFATDQHVMTGRVLNQVARFFDAWRK